MTGEAKRHRVAITGIGLVTPLGADLDLFWRSLLKGVSGVRRITLFDASHLPCQIAGEVPDFDPRQYISRKEARRMSRATQMAVAAASLALADASLTAPLGRPAAAGVYFGTAIGGFDKAEQAIQVLRGQGLSRVNPFSLPSSLPNMPAFHIAQMSGALGPNTTFCTACATGTQAVGEAAHAIRHGRAELMLAGGVEALIQDYTLAGFSAMRALPTSFNKQPERASRPFDAKREGFVFSEGAACVVLERMDRAVARGARIYAEVAGYASSCDGFHIAAPDPDATGAVRTMAWALQDAQLDRDAVDYINAHGTSTPTNDAVETLAIKKLFGDRAYAIPISSTKSMLGHAMGASGAIEVGVCALTIHHGWIHPTINYEFADETCDLDYVPNLARQVQVRVSLSNSFGLGGQNACVILKKPEI